MQFANPFTAPGQWFRGNLHTHTTGSDGRHTPDEIARRYRAAGYDLLAITDHGVVTDVAGLSDDNFLVLFGAEMDGDSSETGESYHICAFGLSGVAQACPGARPRAPDNPQVQQAVDWARASGGEAVIAHPYWSWPCLPRPPPLRRLPGHRGVQHHLPRPQWEGLRGRPVGRPARPRAAGVGLRSGRLPRPGRLRPGACDGEGYRAHSRGDHGLPEGRPVLLLLGPGDPRPRARPGRGASAHLASSHDQLRGARVGWGRHSPPRRPAHGRGHLSPARADRLPSRRVPGLRGPVGLVQPDLLRPSQRDLP